MERYTNQSIIDAAIAAGADETHIEFLKGLIASIPSVKCVELWLQQVWGCKTEMFEPTYALTRSEWRKHSDHGDIRSGFIELDRRIEVKHSWKHSWKDADTFPFDDFEIENVAAHNRRVPIPYAYVIMESNMKHVGVVKVEKTRDLWYDDIKNEPRPLREKAKCYYVAKTVPNYYEIPDNILEKIMEMYYGKRK